MHFMIALCNGIFIFCPLSWVHFILLFMIYYYFKFQFEALFTYGLFKKESAIKIYVLPDILNNRD